MLNRIPLIYYLCFIFLGILIFQSFKYIPQQQSANQAYSWLQGRLDLPKDSFSIDTVNHNGKQFWTLGPFTSVLLVPIVALLNSANYSQNILNFLLTLISTYLLYKLAKVYEFSKQNCLWLMLAFISGSVFTQAILYPKSWNLAHVVTVTLMLTALVENKLKNRSLLIGTLLALILATRPTAFLGIIFFLLQILSSPIKVKQKVKNIVLLIFPSIIIFGGLLAYNYARFENPFKTDYQEIAHAVYFPILDDMYPNTDHKKLFDLKYIPRNIMVYFLTPFKKAIWGFDISALIIGLPFLFSLKTKSTTKEVKNALLTTTVILLPLLAYYWPGWGQIGPIYLNDLMPFLYILLLNSFSEKNLPNLFKHAVIYSFILNTLLVIYLSIPA